MKKSNRIFSLVLALVMVLSFIPNVAEAQEGTTKNITVLGTSDIHSNLYGFAYEDNEETDDDGAARVYSYIQEVRAENPNTVLIDNGDIYQGQIISDTVYNNLPDAEHPVSKYLNFAKYDALTLGNHEFNFGVDFIERFKSELELPILAANAVYKDGSEMAKPYTVVERDGVKIAILGLTNPNAPRWDGEKVDPIEFSGVSETAQRYVDVLRNEENVDIVIASVHTGLNAEYDPVNREDGADKLLETVEGIDAVMLGHAHLKLADEKNGVIYGMPRNLGQDVVRFDFVVEEQADGSYAISDKTVNTIETVNYQPSQEIRDLINEEHEYTIDFINNSNFGTATAKFQPENEITGIPEGKLRDTAVIDLIAKVQLEMSGADVTSVALFTDKSDILEGPVNYGTLFDIYKFDNTLYTVDVTGKELKDYMEWSAGHYNTLKEGDVSVSFDRSVPGYRYDMFEGVDYKIDLSEEKGSRIKDVMFNGAPLQDDQVLKLALNNYRYSSALKAQNLVAGEKDWESPIAIRENIGAYVEAQGEISPFVTNNWEIVNDLSHPLRDDLIKLVNMGELAVPYNESLNINTLTEQGVIVDGELAPEYRKLLNWSDLEIDPQEPIEIIPLQGWHVIDGNVRYYVEGTPLKGMTKANTETIYLFDGEGNRQYGWHVVDGKALYFNEENGGLLTGLRTIGQTTYLLTTEGKMTGWHNLDGKHYYFSPEHGGMLTGRVKVGQTTYLLTSEGKKFGWHRLDGKDYYFSPEHGGGMITGIRTVGQTKYEFHSPEGHKLRIVK